MRGHRGYNICPWLKIGKLEICGKSCREEYCKAHKYCIRKGSRIPRPCLNCGIGVRSQIQVCRGCGREGIRKQRIRLEKAMLGPSAPLEATSVGCPTDKKWEVCPKTGMTIDYEFCFGLRD